LKIQLYRQLEGSCNGRHGYIIAVNSVEQVDSGIVQESSGAVTFDVRCRAVVMKPYKNEVLDARVKTVNKIGFFATIGPLQVFVSSHVSSVRVKCPRYHHKHQFNPLDMYSKNVFALLLGNCDSPGPSSVCNQVLGSPGE